MMILATVPVHAESIDLEALSLDELVSLRNRITDIISTRTVSTENEIYGGMYIVGEDIKPGKHVFSFVRLAKRYGSGRLVLYIKDESGEYSIEEEHYLDIEEEYYLDLTEGMAIEIDNGTGIIRETVKPVWLP